MKLFFSLWMIFILNIFSATAQNYQTVNSGAPRFFIDTTGYIRAINMDSVQFSGTDSLLFPFKTARDTMSIQFSVGCIDGYGPSWIGHTVIIRSDGINIFLNKDNDSIFFDTQAQPGNSWTIFTFQNSNYIEATVLTVAYIPVLATNDSVKYISLQAKDFSGNNISHSMNGKQFALSMNYGFVQLYDFYFFPDYNSPYANANKFKLSTDHVPTIGEINNFDVGDEFETHSYITWPTTNPGSYSRTIILSKNLNAAGDTICYDVSSRQVNYWVVWNPSPHLDSSVSTGTNSICYTNLNDPYYVGMPEQSLDVMTGWHQFVMYHNSDYCSKIRISDEWGWNSWDVGDSCLFGNYFEPPTNNFIRIAGCLPNLFYHGDPMSSYQTSLTYMKKDSCIYGYPYLWTDVYEALNNSRIIIYPNPVSSEIIIESAGNKTYHLEMYNLTGKSVLSEYYFETQKQIISVNHLPNGIYFLKISDENNFEFRKVIVSH